MDAETLNQLVLEVRKFVRNRLVPLEDEAEIRAEIPDEIVEEMRELGFFGLSIPHEYGGLGLNLLEEISVIREFGYTAPAFRSVFGTNVGIGAMGILIDGTDAQKQTYLPRLASGELIGSFALTEPDTGSDAAAVKTSARRHGDGYVLNGVKRYITNAPRAGLFTVMARTGEVEERGRGVSAFLVEADTPGISIGAPERKMGQKASYVSDVIFDAVYAPRDAIIGGVEGQGFKTAMKVLDRGRIHISAMCVGAAQRLIDESLRYALERRQFGSRIADFQLIQALLADSYTEHAAGDALIEATARDYDAGRKVSDRAAAAKLYCSEMVGRVADRAVQIHGGAGYIADYAVERFYRDVRLFRL